MTRPAEPDKVLVAAAARGDRDAVTTLFDRHAETMTRYTWALVRRRMDVEEIVQDAFLTLWQKADTVDVPGESVLPWLLVVCRNHAANLVRQQRRHEGVDLPDELAAPEPDDDARERLRWVRAEIDALAPLDRRVCELCLIEGRSYAEAAEVLGMTIGAVTQRVWRSRARIKKAVTNDER
ncbi:RNA polymerase sigma factor [Curtobacterium sp. SP.BCo]|uniref:RNA polymerase sigma factor n=1 Tax=Curtobacterium sp. SP.BCo TaxID=3435229 RepID=UPI003F74170A